MQPCSRKPARYQHRLPERAERPGALRGTDPAAVGGQSAGEELDGAVRDVERGSAGDQCEASG
jgi:hypothetical protein